MTGNAEKILKGATARRLAIGCPPLYRSSADREQLIGQVRREGT
ncbi:hypothetical protein [Corynebacterium hylobatis]|nr:hypothetical protein [Corynebacterium hylobatis]